MNLKIWGATTLARFTNSISEGFHRIGISSNEAPPFTAGIAQIHGAPQSASEDLDILNESFDSIFPVVYLIHRPDEILENQNLMSTLSKLNSSRFILLGDLVLQMPFWSSRQDRCIIIPHPFTDFTRPSSYHKPIVGSFTSWGEMRKLEHYLQLISEFKDKEKFEFRIGGPGLDKAKIPAPVHVSTDFFVPHFNVQLYHLKGKKRLGESSGSLHCGISIPIIFEANGTEKLEQLLVIKVDADESLTDINFKAAAEEIEKIAATNLEQSLEYNFKQAQNNSVESFARSVLQLWKL